jgi:hypothetical protein
MRLSRLFPSSSPSCQRTRPAPTRPPTRPRRRPARAAADPAHEHKFEGGEVVPRRHGAAVARREGRRASPTPAPWPIWRRRHQAEPVGGDRRRSVGHCRRSGRGDQGPQTPAPRSQGLRRRLHEGATRPSTVIELAGEKATSRPSRPARRSRAQNRSSPMNGRSLYRRTSGARRAASNRPCAARLDVDPRRGVCGSSRSSPAAMPGRTATAVTRHGGRRAPTLPARRRTPATASTPMGSPAATRTPAAALLRMHHDNYVRKSVFARQRQATSRPAQRVDGRVRPEVPVGFQVRRASTSPASSRSTSPGRRDCPARVF